MRAIEVIGFKGVSQGFIIEHDHFVRFFNADSYRPSASTPCKKFDYMAACATRRSEVDFLMTSKCRNTKRDRNYFVKTFNAIFNTI